MNRHFRVVGLKWAASDVILERSLGGDNLFFGGRGRFLTIVTTTKLTAVSPAGNGALNRASAGVRTK